MKVIDGSGAIALGMLVLFIAANFISRPAVLYAIAGGFVILVLLALTL